MKTFLFPGQGSQAKGMGGTLFDEFKALTDKADKILGYSIKELCLDDPRKELNQTQFTQAALYVVNTLYYFKAIKVSPKPDFVAGHSLGEFNALLAAECFDFETGLMLVKKRGELMSRATGGGMAAIINATKEEIETILAENKLTAVFVANYNTPSQIVISGLKDEVGKAESFFQKGNMRYIPLNTSGAFHSKYMQSSKEEFCTYLKNFKFADLQIPVISNVSAKPYQNADVINNLSNQITSPVKWTESIQYLMARGNMEFEEIGHGRVLTNLVQKIQEETPKSSEKVREALPDKEVEARPQSQVVKKDQPAAVEVNKSERAQPLTPEEKVKAWNEKYPIGTRVKSLIKKDDILVTRTRAVVLFGHRAAVYLKGYNGYFDLDEITAV
jgi:malonyl CoA-acyl carrier protein transacylase